MAAGRVVLNCNRPVVALFAAFLLAFGAAGAVAQDNIQADVAELNAGKEELERIVASRPPSLPPEMEKYYLELGRMTQLQAEYQPWSQDERRWREYLKMRDAAAAQHVMEPLKPFLSKGVLPNPTPVPLGQGPGAPSGAGKEAAASSATGSPGASAPAEVDSLAARTGGYPAVQLSAEIPWDMAAIKQYNAYRVRYLANQSQILDSNLASLRAQAWASWAMLIAVLLILVASIGAAIYEFRQSALLRSRDRKDPANKEEIELSLDKLAIKSSNNAALLLVAAMVFLFMYLKFVYPIEVIRW